MPGRGERILAGELVATSVLVTTRDLSRGQVPRPRVYFGTLVVFAALSAVALVSDDFGDVAAGLGGLVLLAALMQGFSPPAGTPDVLTWTVRQSATGFQDNQPPAKHGSNPLQDASGVAGALFGGTFSNIGRLFGQIGGGPAPVPVPTAALPGGAP